jgi:hypothetical protein
MTTEVLPNSAEIDFTSLVEDALNAFLIDSSYATTIIIKARALADELAD